jgi:hypothetical protein
MLHISNITSRAGKAHGNIIFSLITVVCVHLLSVGTVYGWQVVSEEARRAVMDKDIWTFFRCDKSVTFLVTEPLNFSSCHYLLPPFFEI